MPTIKIGQTNKRINSTSRVFYAGGTSLSCKLKESCSTQRPVFEVQGLTKGTNYNFAEFEGNYYWVDDIVYKTNNIQDVYCHLDPLATYRDAIEDSYGMVIYGDSSHHNIYTDDGRIQPEMLGHSYSAGVEMFGLKTSRKGCVVMTFTQTSTVDFLSLAPYTVADCGIHCALMSMDTFKDCIADLNNFDVTGGIIEIAQAFGRAFSGGTLLDNILRVIWLPFDIDDIVTKLGISSSGYRLGLMLGGVLNDHAEWYELETGAIYSHDDTFTIDWDALTEDNYILRHDRFISLQINTGAGYISVPTDKFMTGSDTLYTRTVFCLNDGSWSFKVSAYAPRRDTLVATGGNVSVNLMGTVYAGPTASNIISDIGAKFVTGAVALGVGNVIAGVASAGGVGASASQIASAGKAYQAGMLSTSSFSNVSIGESLGEVAGGHMPTGIMGIIPASGVSARCTEGTFNGASTALFLNGADAGKMYLQATVFYPAFMYGDSSAYTDYCNEYGFPCNTYMRIGDISGYCMCASANVSDIRGASEANKATINNFLNNGIYLEE